jgi:hypothetical protein
LACLGRCVNLRWQLNCLGSYRFLDVYYLRGAIYLLYSITRLMDQFILPYMFGCLKLLRKHNSSPLQACCGCLRNFPYHWDAKVCFFEENLVATVVRDESFCHCNYSHIDHCLSFIHNHSISVLMLSSELTKYCSITFMVALMQS